MNGDKLIRAAMTAVVVAVAGFAAVVSYSHIYGLGRAHGQDGAAARLLPLSVDGLIVAASMVLLHEARNGRGAPGRAVMSSLVPKPPGDLGSLPVGVVRAEVAGAWSLSTRPGSPGCCRRWAARSGRPAGAAALGKALQRTGRPASARSAWSGRLPCPRGRSRGRRLRRQRGALRVTRLHPPPHPGQHRAPPAGPVHSRTPERPDR